MIVKISPDVPLIQGKELSYDQIVEMVVAYRDSQFNTLTQELGREDSRYTWFNIDELIDFLQRMKYVHEATGCRIYFASHTQAVIDQVAGTDSAYSGYAGRMTPIFIATKKYGNNEYELIESNQFVAIPGFDFGTLNPPGANHHIQRTTQEPQSDIVVEVY